ncbi:SET domain-containing protein 5 [Colletotrichum tanaceti]|uniref:SET domain-containing protein 5 n=1 Tax=Colletotrichum tanaceti TaxID=1306861 RepID=A0A4U6XK31_9PEZI|nr:SET domain-containing protein 5 [Colletotrichum tanaceti]TKW56164.1 SET domain-containing protein 5 [Colletotrichum tanaceti]
MSVRMLLAALAVVGHAQGLKPQYPVFESCAASPLLPDSQRACGKSTMLAPEAPPTVDRLAAPNGTVVEKKGSWRWDEGWRGPHSCVVPFCAYSRPSFAGGRGIVLVSTSHNAEEASRLPAFSNESVAGDGDGELFRVVEVPGKGLGLVANQPIRRGQRIMAHPPAVVVHRRFIDVVDLEGQHRLLDDAVAQLPDDTRRAFMEQVGQSAEHASPGHKIHDIMHTNSFELSLGIRDGHHFGNYPEVSRFNHDCRPNVAFYIDDSDLRHYTHAVRAIQAGEELTISYVDSLTARVVRQDRAQRNWGFGCACEHCSLPEALVHASDQRLVRMWEIEQQLSHWNGEEVVDEEMIETLVGLYRQEQLDRSHGAEALRLAALNYNSLGMEEEAVEYARLAEEQLLLEGGPRSKPAGDMRSLSRDPRAHYSWRRRV